MKKLIQSVTGGYSSSATVVDGTLILSLPDAISPVVWRMDLGQVRSSALEVREEDGKFMLALKTPREDVHNIAPFATRAQAVRALMAVSRALEQGHGRIRPAANDEPVRQKRGMGKWIGGIALLVVVLFAFNILMHAVGPQTAYMGEEPAAGDAASVETPGVPVSADDFLKSRQ